MSLFSDAMMDAVPVLEDVAGEPVTYSADGTNYPDIIAIPGQTENPEVSTGAQTLVASKSFDWLISKSRIPVAEVKRGNTITRADGSVYRVAAPSGGACWRYSGPEEAYVRIQSVRIA